MDTMEQDTGVGIRMDTVEQGTGAGIRVDTVEQGGEASLKPRLSTLTGPSLPRSARGLAAGSEPHASPLSRPRL